MLKRFIRLAETPNAWYAEVGDLGFNGRNAWKAKKACRVARDAGTAAIRSNGRAWGPHKGGEILGEAWARPEFGRQVRSVGIGTSKSGSP